MSTSTTRSERFRSFLSWTPYVLMAIVPVLVVSAVPALLEFRHSLRQKRFEACLVAVGAEVFVSSDGERLWGLPWDFRLEGATFTDPTTQWPMLMKSRDAWHDCPAIAIQEGELDVVELADFVSSTRCESVLIGFTRIRGRPRRADEPRIKTRRLAWHWVDDESKSLLSDWFDAETISDGGYTVTEPPSDRR